MSESDVTKPLMNALKQDSFLPEDYVKSKGERRANMLSLTLFGVMMLTVVGAFFATNRKWMSVRNEQRSVNAMYVREAEKIEGLKALEKQRSEMITKAEVTAALVERVPRSVLFAELVRRMPENLTLTELELTSDEVKVARGSARSSGVRTLSGSTGSKSKSKSKSKDKDEAESTIYIPQFTQKLRILGVGLGNDDIADYIENLRACELLDGVELKFIKESKIDGVVLRSFELGALIRAGADARGLVKPVEPLSIPDIPTPDRIVPQKPVYLPPTLPVEKGDAEDGEEGEVEINLGALPSASGLFEAPIFAPSASGSAWSSPSGLLDLMGAAARTGERNRSEKAALEAQSPSIEDEDLFPIEEAETVEIPAEEVSVEEDPAEVAPTEEPSPRPMWFTDPVTDDGTGDETGDEAGDGAGDDTGEGDEEVEPVPAAGDDETDPATGDDDSEEGDEPAPADGDDQEDE